MKTLKYYGKEYGLVYTTYDLVKAKVYGDILNKLFIRDYGDKYIREKFVVLLNHNIMKSGKTRHELYVKFPWANYVHDIEKE